MCMKKLKLRSNNSRFKKEKTVSFHSLSFLFYFTNAGFIDAATKYTIFTVNIPQAIPSAIPHKTSVK